VYQPWIPTGEQSRLLIRIAATESGSLYALDKKGFWRHDSVGALCSFRF
jgi:hypothetical protein